MKGMLLAILGVLGALIPAAGQKPANLAPVSTMPSRFVLPEDSRLKLDLTGYFTDDNTSGAQLKYEVIRDGRWVKGEKEEAPPALLITPRTADFYSGPLDTLVLEARDEEGLSIRDTLAVEVQPVHDLGLPPAVLLQQGDAKSLALAGLVALAPGQNLGDLRWSFGASGELAVEQSGQDLRISSRGDSAGVFFVSVTAIDPTRKSQAVSQLPDHATLDSATVFVSMDQLKVVVVERFVIPADTVQALSGLPVAVDLNRYLSHLPESSRDRATWKVESLSATEVSARIQSDNTLLIEPNNRLIGKSDIQLAVADPVYNEKGFLTLTVVFLPSLSIDFGLTPHRLLAGQPDTLELSSFTNGVLQGEDLKWAFEVVSGRNLGVELLDTTQQAVLRPDSSWLGDARVRFEVQSVTARTIENDAGTRILIPPDYAATDTLNLQIEPFSIVEDAADIDAFEDVPVRIQLGALLSNTYGLSRAQSKWTIIELGEGIESAQVEMSDLSLLVTPTPDYDSFSFISLGVNFDDNRFSRFADRMVLRINWKPAIDIDFDTDTLRSSVSKKIPLRPHHLAPPYSDEVSWSVSTSAGTVLDVVVRDDTLLLTTTDERFLGLADIHLTAQDQQVPEPVATDQLAHLGTPAIDSVVVPIRVIPDRFVDEAADFRGQEGVPVEIDLNRLITKSYHKNPGEAVWAVVGRDDRLKDVELDLVRDKLRISPAKYLADTASVALEVHFDDPLCAGVRDTTQITITFEPQFSVTFDSAGVQAGVVEKFDLSSKSSPPGLPLVWQVRGLDLGDEISSQVIEDTLVVQAHPEFLGRRYFLLTATDTSRSTLADQEGITFLGGVLDTSQDTLAITSKPLSLVPDSLIRFALEDQLSILDLGAMLTNTYGEAPSTALWAYLDSLLEIRSGPIGQVWQASDFRGTINSEGQLQFLAPRDFSGELLLRLKTWFEPPQFLAFRDTLNLRLSVLPSLNIDWPTVVEVNPSQPPKRIALRNNYRGPDLPLDWQVEVMGKYLRAQIIPGTDSLEIAAPPDFLGEEKVAIRVSATIPSANPQFDGYAQLGVAVLSAGHELLVRVPEYWRQPVRIIDPGFSHLMLKDSLAVSVIEGDSTSFDLAAFARDNDPKASLRWAILYQPADTAAVEIDASQLSLTILPKAKVFGRTTFGLTVVDLDGQIDSAVVILNILPVADLALDSTQVAINGSATLNLRSYAEDLSLRIGEQVTTAYPLAFRTDTTHANLHIRVEIPDSTSGQTLLTPKKDWWGYEWVYLQCYNTADTNTAYVSTDSLLVRVIPDRYGLPVGTDSLYAPIVPDTLQDVDSLRFAWQQKLGPGIGYIADVSESAEFERSVYRFRTTRPRVENADAKARLRPGQYYWWTVLAVSDSGTSYAAPDTVAFFLDRPPEPFLLIAPVDSAIVHTHSPVFLWHNTVDLDNERIYFQFEATADTAAPLLVQKALPEELPLDPFALDSVVQRNIWAAQDTLVYASPDSFPDGVLSWRVKAIDPHGLERVTPWTFCEVNVPRLVAPADSATIDSTDGEGRILPPVLRWTRFRSPQDSLGQVYHLHFSRLPGEFEQITIELTVRGDLDTLEYDLGSSELRTLAYWASTRRDDPWIQWEIYALESIEGQLDSTRIGASRVLKAPQNLTGEIRLLKPENEAFKDSSGLVFSWRQPSVRKFPIYAVEISTDSGFVQEVRRFSPFFKPEIKLQELIAGAEDRKGLPMGREYWWRVQATTEEGVFQSAIWKFYVGRRPDPFALIAPGPRAVVRTLNPVFQWQDTRDPDGTNLVYHLQVVDTLEQGKLGQAANADSVFQELRKAGLAHQVILDRDATWEYSDSVLTYVPPDSMPLVNNKTYRWWVVAEDPQTLRQSSDTLLFELNDFRKVTPPDSSVGRRWPVLRWTRYLPETGQRGGSIVYRVAVKDSSLNRSFSKTYNYTAPAAETLITVRMDDLDASLSDLFANARGPIVWQVRAVEHGADADEGHAFQFFASKDSLITFRSLPNPFSLSKDGTTDFAFVLARPAAEAEVIIYNTLGDPVQILRNQGELGMGVTHRIQWDGVTGGGEEIGTGVYVAELAVRWTGGGLSRLFWKLAVIP